MLNLTFSDQDLLARMRQHLSYDPDTGLFTWLTKGRSRAGARKPGAIAGRLDHGYRWIGFERVTYSAHRLAWLFTHGRFPAEKVDIDHINGQRDDNRICNLREAARAENMWNAKYRVGASGVRGVHWMKKQQTWCVRMQVNGKTIQKYTHDLDEAKQLWEKLAREHHGEFFRPSSLS